MRSLDQRAIDRKVVVTHQMRRARVVDDGGEELRGDIVIEQSIVGDCFDARSG
jgi:hypothetical protein